MDPIFLTPAEARVVTLLFEGKSQKYIAESLGLSRHTVNTHLRKVYAKARVRGAIELVAFTLKRGGFLF